MLERTLVLVKPDGVSRGLIGEILRRFEQRGLKIIGLKMVPVSEAKARLHYTEDIIQRRGKHVHDMLCDYLASGPVVAAVIEGVDAIKNVRKLTGDTEPAVALPGTIRGDFCHLTYKAADIKKQPVKNLIHASSNAEDALREIQLWFTAQELLDFKNVHEEHVF